MAAPGSQSFVPEDSLSSSNLRWTVRNDGLTSSVLVRLNQGESIKGTSDALVYHFGNLRIDGKIDGGIMAGLGRWFAGESSFLETIVCESQHAVCCLAPSHIANLRLLRVDPGREWVLMKSCYFAGDTSVQVNATVQDVWKGLFSKQGFVLVELSGSGDVIMEGYGDIHHVVVPSGEVFRVDNGHLVAIRKGTMYQVVRGGNTWMASWRSGEGLMCEFRGPTELYVHTHVRPPPARNIHH